MEISPPYLLFLGASTDPLSVKTSRGIAEWRPEKCVGQMSMPGCAVSLGLPELDFEAAVARGAKTFILGLANRGGVIAPEWMPYLKQALMHGMDIASGMHRKIADISEIKKLADQLGRQIFDVRHPTIELDIGSGKKRRGKRILAVGTDCSVGKMYSTLALEREMRARGLDVDFRATGQTGILIDGAGISVDAVVADFISGAVETLAPENGEDHWDIIEGQGHEAGREHMRGLAHHSLPDIQNCINANLDAARLTNPNVILAGLAVNSSSLDQQDADDYCRTMTDTYGVPCVDPLRHGMASVVDVILSKQG